MTQKKTQTKVGQKIYVSAKVSQAAYDNCVAIAAQERRSLSQIIEMAMEAYKGQKNGQ